LSIAERLIRDTATLGIDLSDQAAQSLLRLLAELERWNRTYNLTAIRNRADMLTRHLLDSLSVHPDLRGVRIADVGTGAGFPGLPLALVNRDRRFTLIDSNGKKVRFVQHAVRELGLTNVEVVQTRVEAFKPVRPFDTVVARAFAPLPELIAGIAPLCAMQTRVLAMKGKWPRQEIEALPAPWRHEGSRELTVPGLAESRCVIVLSR
jgi:16S rRNA (guanine527-N7)-methyltransferase